ncbi:beta-ketoacyl-[acyl-carrier-protein] synthase family protein [Zobellia barbeyronii]|uniref:3-oxoacyl-[acyl-carrier-protein] synthase 1 n=1 Tax=Zobellia barbeyronii TaxID=2748009 RepID=A0ABS5WJA2_9FLAO|nr:beta-ketoacyl-[acyl-carrier-protein] synthase family protein [Zobellia barbeyronii]MBT2163310.1 beta-ketoacyl-[acyl-carrier-protein] synthase family protein [Zobellia barbeyronii]
MNKVAIVGMDGVFPHCKDMQEFEEKLFSNQSLIRNWDLVASYDKKIRTKVAGYATPEETGFQKFSNGLPDEYPMDLEDISGQIPNVNLATSDLGSAWAMKASLGAIKDAGWTKEEIESEETGVVIGTGSGGQEGTRKVWNLFFEHGKKTRALGSSNVSRSMIYRDAANVSCLIKNKGVCEAIGSACATGLGSIGYAYRLIAFGLQDRVIAGGTEGTALETLIGFDAMQVLSTKFSPEESSRPYDKDRNGFVCSFGCGIVALENYDQAKARGANILGVIDGYFNNSDGDGDMFAPSFDGQQRLWTGLKKQTYINPDVVKAHGTSTATGDVVELFSIAAQLGKDGYHVSAPKSQFGHMLGAAGAVEVIVSLLMLKKQMVSPCLNSDNLKTELESFQTKDDWQGPKEPLAAYRNLLPQLALAKPINQIVCLNYGFGGTNSAMAISKD